MLCIKFKIAKDTLIEKYYILSEINTTTSRYLCFPQTNSELVRNILLMLHK